jgi:hydroxypyruvate isomerase
MPFLDRFDAAARAGFVGVEYASPYDYPHGRAAHPAEGRGPDPSAD